MNEDQIAKRADELMKLDSSIDKDMALFLARSEAKTDETRLLIANLWNQMKVGAGKAWKDLKSPAEIGLVGSTAIVGLAASPGLLPGIAAVMGFGAYFWQRENQNNSLRKLEQQIQKTGANLEESTLNFDEFMELFIQFMEVASKSAFEEKQNYLVNLFVNSVVSSTIPFSGKQTLFRLHSQISVEEIHALKFFYDKEPGIAEYEISTLVDRSSNKPVGRVSEAEVAAELKWSEQEARITCEGLSQLGVVYSPTVGTLGNQRNYWRITALGKRFIQWITEEVLPATAAEANTPESTDSAEKTAWSQLTAEQFFSGYSEADAIYDQI
jgi:hypothetical protein